MHFGGPVVDAKRADQPAFELECQALRRVQGEMGLANVVVMLPFWQRIAEPTQMLDIMARQDLNRGESGLQVYIICEIPANLVLIDEFADCSTAS